MAEQKKTNPAAKPAAQPASKVLGSPKPPKKLIPRTAPKVRVTPATAVAVEVPPVASPAIAAAPAIAAVTATARAPRKPSRVDITVAKHQAVLADALKKAQAIKYDQPKVMKQEVARDKKAAKSKKTKLVRDSYAMPETEYAKIGEIKKRLAGLGAEVKKSELLRGGIALLAALNDAELKAVMTRVERIKTGRPSKDAKK